MLRIPQDEQNIALSLIGSGFEHRGHSLGLIKVPAVARGAGAWAGWTGKGALAGATPFSAPFAPFCLPEAEDLAPGGCARE